MMEGIIALLGSSAIGSFIGGIFAFLNRKADLESKKADHIHEQAGWSHELSVKDKDIEYAKVEAQGRKEIAILEGESRIESARMTAIGVVATADSITAEDIKAAGKFGWVLVWAGAFNRLIRPVLTVCLAAAAIYLNWIVIHMMTRNWEQFSTDTQFQIGMQAFSWVTAQASMAFAYWFVSRGVGK